MPQAVTVFREVSPDPGCDCPGCVQERRAVRAAGPAAPQHRYACRAAGRALALAAATGTAVTGTGAGTALAAAHTSATAPAVAQQRVAAAGFAPQGAPAALRAAASRTQVTSRAQIISRAQSWVNARVPYSMNAYRGGYRTDCSGFVSMAWGLPGSEWTGSIARYGTRITKNQLRPGDMLLFHNYANPVNGSHVVIFGGWANSAKTQYIAYEQTRPHTLKRTNPYAYWNHSSGYVAYRYNGLSDTGGGTGGGDGSGSSAYPGASAFGPGARNTHVTQLGRMLMERGGGRFYRVGPGPSWGDADRRATKAFQEAQGWHGSEADGIPGPHTWSLLVNGGGRDIPSGSGGGSGGGGGGGGGGSAATPFPGAGKFRPGQSNAYVTQLGQRLVAKGYGRHYSSGPGPRWSESDRRNVEAFQRAQGWRGASADGYPGPETWRRLFR